MAGKWHLGVLVVFMFSLLVFGPSFRTSADALDSWQLVTTSPYGPIYSIAYGNGVFVAVSDNANYISSSIQGGISVSSDGINWNHTETYYSFYQVLFAGGIFVANGEDFDSGTGYLYASTNGTNWSDSDYYDEPLNGVAYGDGLYVAVGYDYDDGEYPDSGTSYTSTNGLNWTYHATGTTNFLTGVAYGNGIFLAVGGPNSAFANPTNAIILKSVNGTNWTTIPNSFGMILSGVTYVNGRFYATQTVYHYPNPSTYYVYSSTNGSTWTQVVTPQPNIFIPTSPSTLSNGIYVAVNTNGSVQTSPDTTNWTSRITGITNDLYAIAIGPGNLIAGGEGGAIFRSGSTLPSLSGIQQTGSGGFELTLAGGTGPAYRIEGSADLIHWSSLGTITNIEAAPQFLDLSASNYSSRFYRAVWP